jgi:hypothetical protein
VPKRTKTNTFLRLSKGALLTLVFALAGSLSFFLGLQTSSDVAQVEQSIAQAISTTQVNVILQYLPVAGGDPRPIEVTPFMNASQTALVQLQEIHSGVIAPASPSDRCKTTNSVGRCSVEQLPVGTNPSLGVTVDQQYDIIVDTVFIEFLTGIPLLSENAYVKFDLSQCGSGTVFTGNTWCLTKSGGNFAEEYFVTITLNERDVCVDSTPPASFCDISGKLVNFSCNPSFNGATKPWEPKPKACDTSQCPDGNFVNGQCAELTPGLAACSQAAACQNNQLCSVRNFGSTISYNAGTDAIVIRGERFGSAGGMVIFPTESGGTEEVQIPAGPNWSNTEITVQVPLNAVSGTLNIHPNSHGFIENNGVFTPVTCQSPPASIRAFKDQFSILSINGTSPNGVRLVSPGFDTSFALLVHHNDAVSRFDQVLVELVEGSFPDPNNLPVNRTLITQKSCSVQVVGSNSAKEATLTCAVPIPESAGTFQGPFTFIVTVFDDRGESARTVVLDSGSSSLAGDFNLDGILSIHDAAIAFRISRGSSVTLPEHLERDTDADGQITLTDALFVLHSLTKQ